MGIPPASPILFQNLSFYNINNQSESLTKMISLQVLFQRNELKRVRGWTLGRSLPVSRTLKSAAFADGISMLKKKIVPSNNHTCLVDYNKIIIIPLILTADKHFSHLHPLN